MLIKASSRAGRLVVQQSGPEGFSAFLPNPVPPNPPLQYDDEIKDLIEKANRALGRLDGATYMLPNPNLFLYMYVTQLSSTTEFPTCYNSALIYHPLAFNKPEPETVLAFCIQPSI